MSIGHDNKKRNVTFPSEIDSHTKKRRYQKIDGPNKIVRYILLLEAKISEFGSISFGIHELSPSCHLYYFLVFIYFLYTNTVDTNRMTHLAMSIQTIKDKLTKL